MSNIIAGLRQLLAEHDELAVVREDLHLARKAIAQADAQASALLVERDDLRAKLASTPGSIRVELTREEREHITRAIEIANGWHGQECVICSRVRLAIK